MHFFDTQVYYSLHVIQEKKRAPDIVQIKINILSKCPTCEVIEGIGEVCVGVGLLLEPVELAIVFQDEVSWPPIFDMFAWKDKNNFNLGIFKEAPIKDRVR